MRIAVQIRRSLVIGAVALLAAFSQGQGLTREEYEEAMRELRNAQRSLELATRIAEEAQAKIEAAQQKLSGMDVREATATATGKSQTLVEAQKEVNLERTGRQFALDLKAREIELKGLAGIADMYRSTAPKADIFVRQAPVIVVVLSAEEVFRSHWTEDVSRAFGSLSWTNIPSTFRSWDLKLDSSFFAPYSTYRFGLKWTEPEPKVCPAEAAAEAERREDNKATKTDEILKSFDRFRP